MTQLGQIGGAVVPIDDRQERLLRTVLADQMIKTAVAMLEHAHQLAPDLPLPDFSTVWAKSYTTCYGKPHNVTGAPDGLR